MGHYMFEQPMIDQSEIDAFTKGMRTIIEGSGGKPGEITPGLVSPNRIKHGMLHSY